MELQKMESRISYMPFTLDVAASPESNGQKCPLENQMTTNLPANGHLWPLESIKSKRQAVQTVKLCCRRAMVDEKRYEYGTKMVLIRSARASLFERAVRLGRYRRSDVYGGSN